jgi:hypothetical protein
MEIAYRAHTETCTLLLDANGICRSVQAISSTYNGRPARIPSSAERCIGAQFVASLDLHAEGALTHMPEPGGQLLFARIEIDGRITLVRSAPLVQFEAVTGGASGVHEREGLDYDEDDGKTEPMIDLDDATVPRAPRVTSYPPPRESMKVPARRAPSGLPRVSIPPLPPPPNLRPPPPLHDSGPTLPRRPSVARVGTYAMFGEAPTLPFRRAAR